MPRLIRSPSALLDVQRLYRVLATRNSGAARRAVKAMCEEVKVLALQPAIGRPIEDLPEAFREWVIDFGDRGYVARNRVDADGVTILAVRHQKEAGF